MNQHSQASGHETRCRSGALEEVARPQLVFLQDRTVTGRYNRLAHQKYQFGTRPVRISEVDGSIRLLQAEVERSKTCRQVDRDPGVFPQELWDAWGKPPGSEGWQYRKVERSALRVGAEAERGVGDAPESLPDLAGIRPADVRRTV